MFSCAGFGYGLWWLFPVIMIVMMILCFLMMRGHMGSMMCCSGRRKQKGNTKVISDHREEG